MEVLYIILVPILAAIGGCFLGIGLRLMTYKPRYPIMTKPCMVFNKKKNCIELSYGVSHDAVRKNF